MTTEIDNAIKERLRHFAQCERRLEQLKREIEQVSWERKDLLTDLAWFFAQLTDGQNT